MEGVYTQYMATHEMVEKPHPLSFLGRRTFAPRPLSEATDIIDTDFEDDDEFDDNSPSDLDSTSTLSTQDDLATPPLTGGLGGYEFHFDERPTSGPYSPHLFGEKVSDLTELIIAASPSQSPRQTFAPRYTSVSHLDERQAQSWTPQEVAQWVTSAGFDDLIVEKFLVHDICGSVLLDMQLEDLKEIEISSFGKRHRVMSAIQRLRDSAILETSLSRKTSLRSPARSQSQRRGRHAPLTVDVTPEESVSIVAIEQLLPKPHICSKGENCSKWQKQQRKILKLEEEFQADVKSIVVPSVVGSSDILGPSASFNITRERLSTLQPRDPQENVRQFLSFQHVHSPTTACSPSPPPAPSAKMAQQLHGLPKLTIPAEQRIIDSPFRTPASAFRNPSEVQARLRSELQEDPYHYGGIASPVDVYRLDTSVSTTDIPMTVSAIDPCARDASQSVPPEMRYGSQYMTLAADPITRSHSAQPVVRRQRRPSFAPAVNPVREDAPITATTPVMSEQELVNHAGWMRKRKTTRMMRHEWTDNYFALQGSKLDMLENEAGNAEVVESIDIDNYVLHAYTTASSSKLSAAFKKGKATSAEPTFAFSLISENKKMFDNERSHHFAVNSGKDRVEWMRKLMLAKAMKKNDGQI